VESSYLFTFPSNTFPELHPQQARVSPFEWGMLDDLKPNLE
jgi:hypothetical protein